MTRPRHASGCVLPGGTIGILGGGQLGRMTALAARSMGYRIHSMDPDPACPIFPIADQCVVASWDDAAAAAQLARECDVVTLEIERLSSATLEAAAQHAPMRPSAEVLELTQSRLRQKSWLQSHGFPVGPFAPCLSATDLAEAADRFGHTFVKASEGGYDGRSQARLRDAAEALPTWKLLGERPCIAEKALTLGGEISVLVARRPGGQMAVYPPAWNQHEAGILELSVIPAPVEPALTRRAQQLAADLAQQIGVVGLLVVEMFVLPNGELLVNEIAPRPHNSYHASERACETSQFEQLVRAVCDLPLGSVEVLRPAAIANLLGDLWLAPDMDLAAALEVEGTRLHLYGKQVARPGRKMGHLSAIGATPEEALARVQRARQTLLPRQNSPTPASPTLEIPQEGVLSR